MLALNIIVIALMIIILIILRRVEKLEAWIRVHDAIKPCPVPGQNRNV